MQLARFTPPYRLHVGCNTTKIDGFINVDTRATAASDVVHDCKDLSIFPERSVALAFSHAFFEHLYLAQRLPFLVDLRRVLADDGIVYFCGIPDFEAIARCYLERRPGNVSERFDLWEVYRYTHGAPEQQPDWWLEQLHKSLFDLPSLVGLLAEAGFRSPSLYRYAYAAEPNAMNFGFLAKRSGAPIRRDEAMAYVRMFESINHPNRIEWLGSG